MWNGKFEGSLKKRAGKPNMKGRVVGEYERNFPETDADIPLATHHVVDWELLRGAWNRLIDDKHFATICIWLYAVGFDTNNIYYETGKAQTPADIAKMLKCGGDVCDIADVDEIHQRVTWSTWNLVEGPKEDTRSDDLGNFHDKFSNVSGLTQAERADFVLTDNVYTALKSLDLSSPVAAERATHVSNALLAVNRNAQVIQYRPEMWVNNETGQKKCWRKKTI